MNILRNYFLKDWNFEHTLAYANDINTQCTLTVTYVKGTYTLTTGNTVSAKVWATNGRGDSTTQTATSTGTLP